jgi:hypothetical protein
MTERTLTSNGKLGALIRRVNALIPDSVKPSTRISIHPCDWIELVNEIDDLQKRGSSETEEPLIHTLVRGYIKGGVLKLPPDKMGELLNLIGPPSAQKAGEQQK